MSDPLEVIVVGMDSSGRQVKMTRRMWQAFNTACRRSGVRPVIVQGAFNVGVSDSAGTHDRSGAIDTRTWNLTDAQRDAWQRAARAIGWAAWYRTEAQGFDEHMHSVLLGDRPMHMATADQAADYRAGRNGLANNGPDDFWRPDPIPQYRYKQEDDEMTGDDFERIRGIVESEVRPLKKSVAALREGSRTRQAQVLDALDQIVNTQSKQARAEQVARLRDTLTEETA